MKNRFPHYILIITACLCLSFLQSNAQLKAAFTANNVSGCSPLLVQFKDESTGTPTSWYWELGNGAVSTFQEPSAVYYNPGTYLVKLVVKNANGLDSVEKQQYITVNDHPFAGFSNSDSVGCMPLAVSFINKSNVQGSTINKWEWDFGDGYTDSVANPKHNYATAGNFTITLKVTTDKGCSNSFSKYQHIKVNPRVKAGFDFIMAVNSCTVPVTINFVNRSSEQGTVAYHWNFGDGQVSTVKEPQHNYTSNGSYITTLVTVTPGGCRDTVRKALSFANASTRFNIPDTVCSGQNIYLANSSIPEPVSLQWDFGDGTGSTTVNPQKNYTASGSYKVKLVNQFAGCSDSLVKTIIVLEKPVASFSSDRTYACTIPAPIQYISTSTGAVAYKWDFGDGTFANTPRPLHIYKAYGSYTVKLFVTNSNGCVDSVVSKNYILVRSPKVFISNLPVKGCVPLTVPFSPSFLVQDVITSYKWDFGDGTFSSQKSPVKIYSTEGRFTVKLVVTTSGGCMDSVTIKDGVLTSAPVQADFSAALRDVCASTPISFTNQSKPTGDQWLWLFGDGGRSTLQNPVFHYIDTGYFNVTLVVFNKGCSDTITKSRYVHISPPIARFKTVLNCDDKYTRSFIDNSLGAQSWFWEFGDGAISTMQNPIHTFKEKGTYKIKLTVTHDGCTDSNIQEMNIVNEQPIFSFENQQICKGTTLPIAVTDYDTSNLKNLLLYFSNGPGWDTIRQSSHSFTRTGEFSVRLTAKDINGCIIDEIRPQYLKVYGPVAAFDVDQQKICFNNPAAFQDQSGSDGIHPIEKWEWIYGDGTPTETLLVPPFTHIYANGGNYAVTLKITDSFGCTDSISKTNAVIVSEPAAGFTTDDTIYCPFKPIRFVAGSTSSGVSYVWNFGDGSWSTVATPEHQYGHDGLYTVNLQVTDTMGCRQTFKRNDHIKIVTPVAGFSMSDSVGSCPPLQVKFSSTASNYLEISWDFGDGSVSTLDNPVHFYNFPGEYYVRQTVTAPGGCIEVIQKKVIVNGPTGTFTYTPITGCIPFTVQFSAEGVSNVKSQVWDFNDGTTASTAATTIDYTYNRPGHFLPGLVLIDNQGCRVTIPGTDSINAIGVTAKATMDTYRICNSGDILFTDSTEATDDINEHFWDFGDGGTSTLANPVHRYENVPGSYSIIHKVITANGCVANVHLNDTIKVLAVPAITINGAEEACPFSEQTYTAIITGDVANLQTNWDMGNGPVNNSIPVITQSFTTAGTYEVQLQSNYMNFCRDTMRHEVTIWPLPNVFAGNDTLVCLGTPIQIAASGAASYNWQQTADMSCSNCNTTMINPGNNSIYVVTGTSDHGCTNNDSIHVRVRQPFTMQVQKGGTICEGGRFRLEASGADHYQWYPAAGLDKVNIASPQAQPSGTITYSVAGTDADHCFTDTGSVTIVVYPIPKIFAGTDTTVLTGSALQLVANGSPDITKYTWTPSSGLGCASCATITADVKNTITYMVTATNDGGCTASDKITVTAVCNDGNWFIPNTFTPNGDGMNDMFYVRGKGLNLIRSIMIFNRWGQMIFQRKNFAANDPSAGWNGMINGKPVGADSYIYMVELVCENSGIITYKGNVTLLR